MCEKNKENQREREREREREKGGSNLIDQKRGIGSFCGRKKREKLKEFWVAGYRENKNRELCVKKKKKKMWGVNFTLPS